MSRQNARDRNLQIAKREHPNKTVDTLVTVPHWLPEAEELERLEKLYPGVTQKIVDGTFETNNRFQENLFKEKAAHHTDIRFGMIAGIFFAVLCFSFAVYALSLNQIWLSSLAIGFYPCFRNGST